MSKQGQKVPANGFGMVWYAGIGPRSKLFEEASLPLEINCKFEKRFFCRERRGQMRDPSTTSGFRACCYIK